MLDMLGRFRKYILYDIYTFIILDKKLKHKVVLIERFIYYTSILLSPQAELIKETIRLVHFALKIYEHYFQNIEKMIRWYD